MIVTHPIDIDLIHPDATPPRIQVKQGDVMTRNVRLKLYADGTAWSIDPDAEAVIRYCAHDAEGQTLTHGIYDTMEDGSPAWIITGNILEVMPISDMMARPGLVTVDVLLVKGAKMLATFSFEIYVNRAAAEGTEAEAAGYYRVASLDAINTELDTLRAAITALGGGEYLA